MKLFICHQINHAHYDHIVVCAGAIDLEHVQRHGEEMRISARDNYIANMEKAVQAGAEKGRMGKVVKIVIINVKIKGVGF